MADTYDKDIYDDEEDLSLLEDSQETEEEACDFDFPEGLLCIHLAYSSETIYATNPTGIPLEKGNKVIVPTRYGLDMGENFGEIKKPVGVRPSDIVKIERKANADDLAQAKGLVETEEEAGRIFQEKVALHHLDMKFVSSHFLVGETKALFFFTSDNRVDFRELVKDLVSVFRMRIELRQIGAREESRMTGALGMCGRACCCNCVSDKLRPVSIRMAKDQNLSLNSTKISGQCGRLLCCLSFESDWYAEARKSLPAEGIRLYYDDTNFRVTEVNPVTSMVKIQGEDGRVIEVNASRFVRDGKRWRISN